MKCQIYALGRAGKALEKSLRSALLLGEGSPAEILFLTVPDDAIFSVAETLASQQNLPKIVAHLSGAHSYEVLKPLKGKVALAQFHPLVALTGDKPIQPGAQVSISSDEPWAEKVLAHLAQAMQLMPASIDPTKTTQYHAAAVMTGNLSLALVQQSIKLMQEAGIESQTARIGLAKLLRSAAENLETKDINEALTGPIARKDFKTIEKHLEVLNPEVRQVYQTLSTWLGFNPTG